MRSFTLVAAVVAALTSFPIYVAAQQAAIAEAKLVVHVNERLPHPIPKYLTGKFCEHLGANIYNGMDAQILRNPTFADVPFWTGQMSPDGITLFHFEKEKIDAELRRQTTRYGWPEADLPDLLAARVAGLAGFWGRVGEPAATDPSPDTGPHGGRAQRLQLNSGGGIKQWAWLPLHRAKAYQFELLVRSPDLRSLTLSLFPQGATNPAASATISGISTQWQSLRGQCDVAALLASGPCRLELTSAHPGQLVLGHLFLWPADHVNGADPDVIRLLKESHLPLLRWPGGNFVSAYHWQDGVGPVERRPTKPNYAWGGLEPNTFGTAEFVAFCRGVGCEPMICVNAGTGTPEEAARWIEYCNGPASSAGGALRTAHGHPEPFGIRHWEVGNELWGKWQANWTTARGYADRYLQFSAAMLRADPSIHLYACGAPVLWGKPWNDTLIRETANRLRSITDHPLIGGDVSLDVDPLDVYRDFMYVPELLQRKWAGLRADMAGAGIHEPRLAVTELQMFAHLGAAPQNGAPRKLNRENLVSPSTLAEALYDTLIYHEAVRLQPFVEMVTHSATVNHGGGLRKERERVYANPCHYANQLFASFAEATPIKIDLQSPAERAPVVLPEIKSAAANASYTSVDALAAISPKGELLLSLVNRGSAGPVRLSIALDNFQASTARLQTLTASVPWAANSLEHPDAIHLVASEQQIKDNPFTLELPPYSIVQSTLLQN